MECRDCGAALPADARFCLQCGARVHTPQDAAADPLRDALERAIGFQYRIDRLLGRGGMGAVYLAHELALDRDVAIKVLPPEHAGTPEVRARFRREARTAARLTHPNIVPLYTFGEVDGLMYFVMGYVPGESLAARLRREGAIPSDAARVLLDDLANALEYAHRHGVIHRDLKPDNILLDGDSGAPRLTDFGIAKAPLGDVQLTTVGQIIGTPHYMSPEQALGRADVDARSDLYSLGVVAYEMVSGRRPFDAENPVDALTQRLTQDPRPLRAAAPDAADDLVHAISRCLQREPANRWPDVRSLRTTLVSAEAEPDDPFVVRLLRVWTAIALVALIAAAHVAAFKGTQVAIPFLAAALLPLVVFLLGAVIALKRQRVDARAILQIALRQPRWWRFWYPKRFRPRGDVWDRLPPRIRRFRIQSALTFGFVAGFFLPTMLLRRFFGGSEPGLALPLLVIAIMVLLFAERSRTTKFTAAALRVSPLEASKIVSTPSWRTSVWQRGPAAALLQPGTTSGMARPFAVTPSTAATASTTVVTPPPGRPDDEVTRA